MRHAKLARELLDPFRIGAPGEQQVCDESAASPNLVGVRAHDHAFLGGTGARALRPGAAALVDFHNAHPAGAVRLEPRVVAERGDSDVIALSHLEDRFALFGFALSSVDFYLEHVFKPSRLRRRDTPRSTIHT